MHHLSTTKICMQGRCVSCRHLFGGNSCSNDAFNYCPDSQGCMWLPQQLGLRAAALIVRVVCGSPDSWVCVRLPRQLGLHAAALIVRVVCSCPDSQGCVRLPRQLGFRTAGGLGSWCKNQGCLTWFSKKFIKISIRGCNMDIFF